MTDYESLIQELKEVALLTSCGELLGWDEQTNLPPKGAEHRANQLALLAGLSHERATSKKLGDMISKVEDSIGDEEPTSAVAVNVREARRAYDLATKLPQKLVQEMSRVTTLSQQTWIEARKADDFSKFEPWLEKVINLKKEEAQALKKDDADSLYDSLLDHYEPNAKSSEVDAVFKGLKAELVPLVAAIRDSGIEPDLSIVQNDYPADAQRKFGMEAATAIGFDFDAGRLDIAAHPFCSGIGPGDCRLTTRYDERFFNPAFFGTLHEAGHGIYDQGLSDEDFGTGMGSFVSLGIHESQSRMWENLVGRSKPFWEYFYSHAQDAFPSTLNGVELDTFYASINDVRPSLIRVEADEVTYNLHIMLRFEIEQEMINGDLKAADIPERWNTLFEEYFGMTPPNNSNGCMQDVHWSAGLIGYFPTYALGNMYASQFFETAQSELSDLDDQFRTGNFSNLKSWLNTNIHERGCQYSATDLVEVVTGKPLSHEPLMNHLKEKFGNLYGITQS